MAMQKRTVRELAKGEFFRLTESDTAPVRVRGEYSRHAKKYSTHRFDDVNHERLLRGNSSYGWDSHFNLLKNNTQ